MSKIVLVCGGREYADRVSMNEVLSAHVSQDDVVVEGGARGADSLARAWCKDFGVHCATVPAIWDIYGRRAGYERNCAMLRLRPSLVVAFPGGRGTEMMADLASGAEIRVVYASAFLAERDKQRGGK